MSEKTKKGEALERLLLACAELDGIPLGSASLDVLDAWQAYEAAPADELAESEAVNSDHRDKLGRRVREVWVAWANRQPSPKQSWLVPYDQLPEADKEADRCIGSAVWGDCIAANTEAIASHAARQLLPNEAAIKDVLIESLTAERDAAREALKAEKKAIADLQTKLDAEPLEIPECVRELCKLGEDSEASVRQLEDAVKAVRDYYAPPFRVDKPGWYLAIDGKEWRVAEICGNTAWGRNGCDWYGFCTDPSKNRPRTLTKYLRPLEG